jgi:hypothetical protein
MVIVEKSYLLDVCEPLFKGLPIWLVVDAFCVIGVVGGVTIVCSGKSIKIVS